ncbi:hypothetical protein RMCBS344292_14713 [Rhizopus microsporus]|nr:hypothetical protein RMCBS344292_14713 [Rhizopus microsporus]
MTQLLRYLVTLLFIQTIYCYCIYNNSDGTYRVRQQPYNAGGTYFSRFAVEQLKPGDKACCAYTNSDCVKNNDPNDPVWFSVWRLDKIEGVPRYAYFPNTDINVPAGGWLEFGGTGIDASFIRVFYANGTDFDFQRKIDFQSGYY